MALTEYPVVAYIGAWLATIGTVWVLFDRAERIASDEVKHSLRRWLRREVNPSGIRTKWPETFAGVFDSVFGKRHLSWRCVWRSCIASLIAVASLLRFGPRCVLPNLLSS